MQIDAAETCVLIQLSSFNLLIIRSPSASSLLKQQQLDRIERSSIDSNIE